MRKILAANKEREIRQDLRIPARVRDVWIPRSGRWGALCKKEDGCQGRKNDQGGNQKIKRSNLIALGRSHDPGQKDDNSKFRQCNIHDANRITNIVPLNTK